MLRCSVLSALRKPRNATNNNSEFELSIQYNTIQHNTTQHNAGRVRLRGDAIPDALLGFFAMLVVFVACWQRHAKQIKVWFGCGLVAVWLRFGLVRFGSVAVWFGCVRICICIRIRIRIDSLVAHQHCNSTILCFPRETSKYW